MIEFDSRPQEVFYSVYRLYEKKGNNSGHTA